MPDSPARGDFSGPEGRPAGGDGVHCRMMLRLLPYGLSFLVLVGAIVVQIADPPFKAGIRNFAFDAYQRIRPRVYREAPVRIIDIDEQSLAREGQWPWPRTRIGELIQRLADMGAAAIVFDIVFSEPDRTSPARLMERFADSPGIRSLLAQMTDHDAMMAEAMKNAPVVLGFSLQSAPGDAPMPRARARFALQGSSEFWRMARPFGGAIRNLEILENQARGSGAINFPADYDGVIRRVPLLFRLDENADPTRAREARLYPSLAAEAIRVAMGAPIYLVEEAARGQDAEAAREIGIAAVRIGKFRVPTDARAGLWLHYGTPRPERYIPAWRVLERKIEPADVAGRILFVGTSASALQDLRFSPLGGTIPGVEIHAQLVEQILQGTYLARPKWAIWVEGGFMVAIWIVLVGLVARLGVLWSAAIGALVVAVAWAASWQFFAAEKLLFEPLFPTFAAVGMYLACSVPKAMQTEAEQRWIRKAFSSYVSPNLVSYLIDHPGQLSLGGERRECSFVFTDLEGFTALVEKSEPGTLVELLNAYLDGMIGVAFDHEGTLDKIVGDAVAVMFSAPVVQPDHAKRALACALEMDRFAQGYAEHQRAAGHPLGKTRIGVHAGPVTVGNFGGKTIFDYRALGDAINTAARLESVNKQLGTRMCVSEAIVAQCPDFVGRPVGRLVLKGKSKALQTFEPLAPEELASTRVQAYLAAYAKMTAEDPASLDAFVELLGRHPDDGLIAFHAARLIAGETGSHIVLLSK